MVRLREKRNFNRAPPHYKPPNVYLTVVFHHGGKLVCENTVKYVGGERFIIDEVKVSEISMAYLKSLLGDWLFIDCEFTLKNLKDNSYNLVSDDDQLKELCLSSMERREIVFFVEEVDSLRKAVDLGIDAEVVNERETEQNDCGSDLGTVFLSVDEIENLYNGGEVDGDDELSEDDYIVEDEEFETDEDDDGLFNEFVDQEIEEDDVEDQEDSDYIPQSKDSGFEDDNKMFDEFVDDEAERSGEDSGEDSDVVGVTELHEHKDSDDNSNGEDMYPVFNPAVIFQPSFELGMIFSSKKEFQLAVQSYAIKTKRSLILTKTAPDRVYIKCPEEDCKFHINLRKHPEEETFQVRELEDEHTCHEQYEIGNMSSTWLAKRYLHSIVTDRNRKVSVFRRDMMNELGVEITMDQAYRANKLALKTLEGDADMQYAKLWQYAEEIKRTNPGSTVIVGAGDEENGDNRFERLYICFEAVKKGFKTGCRPIIGLDGCHLKGPYRGIMLTAVGVDANNSIYPIAWSVVRSECNDTWEWFLVVLKHDLGLEEDSHYTFMSDKQKGLIQAMSSIFPNVEHRFCVRHLHENFKMAGFRGDSFKNALWRAAQALTVGEWKQRMIELRSLSEKAWLWLDAKPPKQWTKSHFTEQSKCDMLLNNVCGVFNSAILDAREMPIITMLEWIRTWLMVRFQRNRDISTPKWQGRICPRIKQLLEVNVGKVSGCIPLKSDNYNYEIRCHDSSQYLVDLKKKTCSCREWGLSGIPCSHAISAINHERLNREDYVDECYTVETFKMTYTTTIVGVNGPQLWNDSMYIPPLPPKMERGKGKQSMARRKGPDEADDKKQKKKNRLRRKQSTVTCSKCGIKGHNSRGCGKEKVRKKKNKEATSTSAPHTQPTEEIEDEIDSIPIESVTQLTQIPGPTMFQQLQGSSGAVKRAGPLILPSEKRFCNIADLDGRKD